MGKKNKHLKHLAKEPSKPTMKPEDPEEEVKSAKVDQKSKAIKKEPKVKVDIDSLFKSKKNEI
jgi:hypothetical protein